MENVRMKIVLNNINETREKQRNENNNYNQNALPKTFIKLTNEMKHLSNYEWKQKQKT